MEHRTAQELLLDLQTASLAEAERRVEEERAARQQLAMMRAQAYAPGGAPMSGSELLKNLSDKGALVSLLEDDEDEDKFGHEEQESSKDEKRRIPPPPSLGGP